ncbi:hypothetical protein [Neotamlana laminarinivorans]|uniref:Lipocalin-like protein n=1 Tax=Neotamlana laminarinivorans TaxID=2883124 RepID=A0A9X1L566_9FLAO|nr:hypothetical protein [Tamlana laminarinivorans]MCB4800097.1 hypothetical protein [Tamlana laminarinivorans]
MDKTLKQRNILTIKHLTFIGLIVILTTSCINKKIKDATYTYDYVDIEPEAGKNKGISSLIGDWKLDSVVFINDSTRGQKQIPFNTTIWSFSNKGEYTVKIQQNQYEISVVEDGVKRKTSLSAETPSSIMKGRYKHSNQELTTNILGGNTKYIIVKQSDEQLQLNSQRIQVPPISKADEGKFAEHYFTSIQNKK